MTERRRDLSDIVGEDVPAAELRELERVDELLRSVPGPPPEVPRSLTQAVTTATSERSVRRPWRPASAIAIVAALSAFFFGLGTWVGGDDFESRRTISLEATGSAPSASGQIELGERDARGNWEIRLETSGLPRLPVGGYYVLWLAKDGEYAATCGTFRAGTGTTAVRMNASYRLTDYDAWVITAVRPGDPEDADPPWLLEAQTA